MATLVLFSLVMFGLALLMVNRRTHEACRLIPEQYAYFPALIATLNGTSAVLLLTGRILIMRGKIAAHRACMIAAVVSSALFLACYVYFPPAGRRHPFSRHGGWHVRSIFAILISHVTLAIVIVPMVIITLSPRPERASMTSIAPLRAGPGRCGCMFRSPV